MTELPQLVNNRREVVVSISFLYKWQLGKYKQDFKSQPEVEDLDASIYMYMWQCNNNSLTHTFYWNVSPCTCGQYLSYNSIVGFWEMMKEEIYM